MKTLEVIEDLPGTGFINAPLNIAYEALTTQEYQIISLEENADLIRNSFAYDILQPGNFVLERIVYSPFKKARISRMPLNLEIVKSMTFMHSRGEEYVPSANELEESLVNSANFPNEDVKIPLNRFSEEESLVLAFGGEEKARSFADFLSIKMIDELYISILPESYVNNQKQVFIRPLIFMPSSFCAISRCDGSQRLRGIKKPKFVRGLTDAELVKIVSQECLESWEEYLTLRANLSGALALENYKKFAELKGKLESLNQKFSAKI